MIPIAAAYARTDRIEVQVAPAARTARAVRGGPVVAEGAGIGMRRILEIAGSRQKDIIGAVCLAGEFIT